MTETITLPRSVVEQALEHLTCPVDEPVREAFRAALEQPQDHPEQHLDMVPEGWKLVPVEPTEAMLHAGNSAIENWGVDANGSSTYRAMLAAAPQPPVVEQPQVEQEPVAWMHQCRKKPELVKLSFKKREPALAASGYKARPLIFGDTAKPRQPLTDDERQDVYAKAIKAIDNDPNLSWRDAIVFETERAHGIGGEA